MRAATLSLAAWMASLLPLPIKRRIYRIKPLAKILRSGLNLAAPEGFVVVEVAAGALAGGKLCLDLHVEKDYWLGTYEPELQAAIAEFVHPGSVAYDVGANIGYISLILSRKVGEKGKVIAFEALPNNIERLRTNLALNGMEDRVTVVSAAVVDQPGEVTFMVGPSGGTGKVAGSVGRTELSYSQSISIEGNSLDEFVYQFGYPAPDVVKMDIEGGEVLAIPGMLSILEHARPILFLEIHGEQAAHVAWENLMKVRYRICHMQPGFPAVPSLEHLDWKTYLVAFPL